MIHFRIASVGPVDRLLCHPFEVSEVPDARLSGSAKSVLFANGTWSGWRDWKALAGLHLNGPVSDTRVAAAAVWQYGFDWLRDSGCKFVVLSRKGSWKTIGQFYRQSDGCFYSNLYWKPSPPGHAFPSIRKLEQQFTPRRQASLFDEAMACFGE